MRAEERIAAASIAATLGLEVEQHDDGSDAGMYDLNVLADGAIAAAVEVTAAGDADSIQLWKLVNRRDGRWIEPALRGRWALQLTPTAQARRLFEELPTFLRDLEEQGITEIPERWWGREALGPVERRAQRLGIVGGNQVGTDFPGSIYMTIEQPADRTGGLVDNSGNAVPVWAREFLLDPHQSDVLGKLARSGANERHAFIVLPAFSTAPFGVLDMLWRDQDDVVPATVPDLPDQVTHVWIMTLWTQGSGLRWSSGGGWTRFARQFAAKG